MILLLHFFLGKPSFEFLNAAGSIDQFFFPGIKRVARGADFYLNLFFGLTDRFCVAAGACDFCVRIICWVDTFFHKNVNFIDDLYIRRTSHTGGTITNCFFFGKVLQYFFRMVPYSRYDRSHHR